MSEQELEPLDEEESEQPAKRESSVNELYEWMEWFAGIAICVVLVLTFCVRTVGVYGSSMESTLLEGDSLLVTRLGRDLQGGDIVAITQPNRNNQPLIKRVIATGGQTIDIDYDTSTVWVDGVALQEPYINEAEMYGMALYDVPMPLLVPEGCVFAMGDNRNHSLDSRNSDIGIVDERYVLGKVLVRFAPISRFGRP